MNTAVAAPCDRAEAGATPCRGGTRHPRAVLLATILASSLAFIDGSVVNVALPALGRSFDADAAELQWAINAYLLPLSALLLIGGAAGDRWGRRRVLILGVALFLAASMACATAPSLPLFLAARAAQGVGAALLMPNSLATLGAAFDGEARGRAVGTWAAVGAIAAAVGPPLGGWLVDAVGWPAIFLINLPVGAGAIWLAWAYVGESADQDGRALDWPGASTATLALLALTWGATLWSSDRVLSAPAGIAIGAGTVLLAGFVLVERRRGDDAMMPLTLFAGAAFGGLTLFTFLLYGALGALLFLLPYVLIEAVGYSPLDAGLALLPFAIVIGLGSRLMGRIAERIGPRWPLMAGSATAALGFALMALTDPRAGYLAGVLPGVLVTAIGMAGAVAPLTTAVLGSVDRRHTGTASGFNSAIARTGGLIATAMSGAVLAAQGPALIAAFQLAGWVGAAAALASAATAWLSLADDAGRQNGSNR